MLLFLKIVWLSLVFTQLSVSIFIISFAPVPVVLVAPAERSVYFKQFPINTVFSAPQVISWTPQNVICSIYLFT